MSGFVRLQVLPGSPAPLITLHSSAAQVDDVPPQPLALPAAPPASGGELFAALPPAVRAALSQLGRGDAPPITLWLDVQVAEVAAWPWDLLGGASDGAPFACTPQTPLARAYAAPRRPTARGERLRALLVTASPVTLPPLHRRRRSLAMLDALAAELGESLVLTKVESATPGRLRSAVAAHQPALLIALAYGDQNELVLEDGSGQEASLGGDALAALLHGPGMPDVVLASCEGASLQPGRGGLLEALLRAGAPGVAAMRGAMSDDDAAAFLAELLRALASGEALEAAAARGRRAILPPAGPERDAWAPPVCWQRPPARVLIEPSLARGARQLADRAASDGVAQTLAAGGLLAMLAVFGLRPLLAPLFAGGAATVAVPAAAGLLSDLELGALGDLLEEALRGFWSDTGRPPSQHAAPTDLSNALARIAAADAAAARQLEALAVSSRATRLIAESVNRGAAAGAALLAGIQRDLARHDAPLDALRADLRASLLPIHRDALGLGPDSA